MLKVILRPYFKGDEKGNSIKTRALITTDNYEDVTEEYIVDENEILHHFFEK